jgi:hypothetical protein
VQVRHRLLLLAVVVAALAGVVLAGCGGGSDKNAKALLKRGFSESIPSANVSIDVSVKVDGIPQLAQPVRIKLGGPFKSNGPKKLPSLQWDVSFSGGGQTFSAGLVSTGDQAFVNYQGTFYKVDDKTMTQLKLAAARGSTGGSRSLKSFGIDPLAWVKDASDQGETSVAGVTTKHVSAGVDIGKLFEDLNKVVARAGGGVGSVRPRQLTPAVIDQIKQVVHDPKLDVYVGKQDGKIRRAALGLQFTVPKQAQATARGVKGGNVTISVEFAAVGEPQTIQVPASSKPISELAKQLGGLAGLGGATSGLGGSSGGLGGSTGGGGSGKTPSAQQFQRYAQCLNSAKPSDTAAMQRCRSLLK